MINIYDDINKLEATFRQTEEFAELAKTIQAVKEDADALAIFQSFRTMQLALQEKQAQGEDLSEEELMHAQKTAQLAQQNEKIDTMLQAEMKISGLIEEMTRIVVKPVQELYKEIQ